MTQDELWQLKYQEIVDFIYTSHRNKSVEYLGFAFDGKRVLLKDASLCRYYNKMRIDKRRHKHWAILVNNKTNGRVFTNQIVRRFTLAGANRHHILLRQPDGSFIQSPDKAFGNYLTYAYKAAYIMGEPAIKRQLRRDLHKVKKDIAKIKEDVRRVQVTKTKLWRLKSSPIPRKLSAFASEASKFL